MNTNKVLIGVVGVLAIVTAFFVGKSFGSSVVLGGAPSAVGSINTTARIFSVNMAPLTGAATTTSILNPFGFDVAVTSSFAFCQSVGTSNAFGGGAQATFAVQMATTSTSGGGLLGNTNFAANDTIATSSTYAFVSSTTDSGGGNNVGRIWPAATYMSITFNATNTAACTVGGHVIVL